MKRKIGIIVIAATVAFLIAALILCISVLKNDPDQETGVLLAASLLASVMSAVVIIYACLTLNDKDTSKRYHDRFISKNDDTVNNKK